MIRLHESSLSGVNPTELLRLCPAAEAEAQQERGSKPETQGNFFGVCQCNTPNLCYKRQAIRDVGKFKEALRDRA